MRAEGALLTSVPTEPTTPTVQYRFALGLVREGWPNSQALVGVLRELGASEGQHRMSWLCRAALMPCVSYTGHEGMLSQGALPTPFHRYSTLPNSCCLFSWAFQCGNLTCALPCGCFQSQVPEVLVGTRGIWS